MSRILLNRLFGRETTSLCNFCNKKIRRSLSDNKKSIIKPAVQQREYAFFHRVLESLPQNRSLAFAYGSGVFKQDGQSWTRNSMSDFIIVTDDPLKWHKENLRQNPAHYPSAMRYLGHEAIARLQTDFGAKIYFNTLIPFEDGKIKYGVISTEDLIVDLLEWKTLYVSGRLHKPVNILEIDSSNQTLKQGLRANLIYALHAALIQLPSSFQEEDLYLALAGISYTGDLRMLIGEDKNKVSNIVTAQGELFKHLYSKSLATLSDRVHVSDGTITQDTSEEGRYHQLTMLPSTLKRKISEKWNKEGRELDLEEIFLKAIKDPTLTTKIVREGIQTIVQESSSPQAIKGIITAGPLKTVQYSVAKLKKMFKSMK